MWFCVHLFYLKFIIESWVNASFHYGSWQNGQLITFFLGRSWNARAINRWKSISSSDNSLVLRDHTVPFTSFLHSHHCHFLSCWINFEHQEMMLTSTHCAFIWPWRNIDIYIWSFSWFNSDATESPYMCFHLIAVWLLLHAYWTHEPLSTTTKTWQTMWISYSFETPHGILIPISLQLSIWYWWMCDA